MATAAPRSSATATPDREDVRSRAAKLGLHGLVAHWGEYGDAEWLPALIEREEAERRQRGLERRIKKARIGRFKFLADFDWVWPKKIDRELIEEIFTLDFLETAEGKKLPGNVVFVGPNGVGKTMIAQNLAHQAVLRGHTVRFTTASEMLNDLADTDSTAALGRRLRRYTNPALLAVDEVGYLSYDARHADLLFEVVSRRQEKSTIVTTNRAFKEWGEVFPNATCVVALVDRLIQRAELVRIDGKSYRLKEAEEREARAAAERAARRAQKRASAKSKKPATT